MGSAATIVFAREDFTIPGAGDEAAAGRRGAVAAETRFFDLLRDSRPDVVVLDLSRSNGHGVETILKIRQESTTPILVVCDVDQPVSHEYRLAGAAECIGAPVDIVLLNQTLQKIIQVTGTHKPRGNRTPDSLAFAGLNFRPHENLVTGADGSSARLTTSENRLLSYFTANAWILRTRAEVGEMLYGRHRPTSDRAIDVVVNRLRKKLVGLCGPSGQNLIKTEFRRGYMFVADVAMRSAGETIDAFERADAEDA
jgi:DNA-binding response OmpR family regulator